MITSQIKKWLQPKADNKSPWASPNFGERKNGVSPSMIILHYTGMQTALAALERLCNPAAEVSAHYVIEEDGAVHALVPEDKRAWHAGQSYWRGERDINSHSIGIELVNPGHEFGYRPFPLAQIEALQKLCAGIITRHSIKPHNILGHSDIAPARKDDPGELFPWQALAASGVGLWPRPVEMDFQAAEDLVLNEEALQELFCSFGYDPAVDLTDIIIAFHRHYYPEKFAAGSDHETPDILTVARLLALIRKGHEGA